jgi:hypothetical protein
LVAIIPIGAVCPHCGCADGGCTIAASIIATRVARVARAPGTTGNRTAGSTCNRASRDRMGRMRAPGVATAAAVISTSTATGAPATSATSGVGIIRDQTGGQQNGSGECREDRAKHGITSL